MREDAGVIHPLRGGGEAGGAEDARGSAQPATAGFLYTPAARRPSRGGFKKDRYTLGWYRLACFLPRALPAAAVSELSESDAATARADYAFVIEAMGVCGRTRG